jgi:hypothetical protein
MKTGSIFILICGATLLGQTQQRPLTPAPSANSVNGHLHLDNRNGAPAVGVDTPLTAPSIITSEAVINSSLRVGNTIQLSTNDLQSLQAALAALANSGGMVLAPAVTYVSNEGLTIPCGVTLRGASVNGLKKGTVLSYPKGAADFVTLAPCSGLQGTEQGGLEDLSIEGSASAGKLVVLADGTSGRTIRNITLDLGAYGIWGNSTKLSIGKNMFDNVAFLHVGKAIHLQSSNSTTSGGFVEMNTFIDPTIRCLSTPCVELVGEPRYKAVYATVFINADASFASNAGVKPPFNGVMFSLTAAYNTLWLGGECDYNNICILADSTSKGIQSEMMAFFGTRTALQGGSPDADSSILITSQEYNYLKLAGDWTLGGVSGGKGFLQIHTVDADPGCKSKEDIGKIWLDNGSTTVEKHCLSVAGKPGWVAR